MAHIVSTTHYWFDVWNLWMDKTTKMVGCLIKTRWRSKDCLLMCCHFPFRKHMQLVDSRSSICMAISNSWNWSSDWLVGWYRFELHPGIPTKAIFQCNRHLDTPGIHPTIPWNSDLTLKLWWLDGFHFFGSFQVHHVPRCDIPRWTRCSGAAANIKRPEQKGKSPTGINGNTTPWATRRTEPIRESDKNYIETLGKRRTCKKWDWFGSFIWSTFVSQPSKKECLHQASLTIHFSFPPRRLIKHIQ